ncbi:hypothetical protein FSS13T_18590 [Flavobacterium saliperosum S13]|uniref:DUF4252 domain-containing protein n=2 Tax=Flavobacterium saliperosum TaxID=329186 RepID=A0A1G4W9N0_9FLAO|nr:hypothetical protein [Flavobacterium saliperosum]ESU25216.1 hypothetical protein FSS13T_18590 [Flavobacterium saliperosum S13]SCX19034.1 hypothetical protein SAMN02927925_02765 [Flavobacterium saliperosum]
MKSLLFIFLVFTSLNIFSQNGDKPFEYTTPKRNIVVVVKIDTTKYKPEYYGNLLSKLYYKKIDASIFINEKNINLNDTISEFQSARKKGELIDLGKVDGERSLIYKKYKTENGKKYILFSYLKIIAPDRSINFTAYMPEENFGLYEGELMNYAKSMHFKKQ